MRYLPLIIITFLAGCSLQKRHYQRGFHYSGFTATKKFQVNRKSHYSGLEASSRPGRIAAVTFRPLPPDSCALLTFFDRTEISVKIVEENGTEIKYYYCDDPAKKLKTASRSRIVSIRHYDGISTTVPEKRNDSDSTLVTQSDRNPTPEPPAESISETALKGECETIYFRDGTEKKAKVLEIGINEITYKNCDTLQYPLYRIYRSEIFMIVHTDGRKEVFPEKPEVLDQPVVKPPNTAQTRRTNNTLAVYAFILAFTGISPLVMVGGIAAIVLGAIYLYKNSQDPEKYISRKLAIAAIIIGAASAMTGGWLIFVAN